jgi:hypothetical protein
MGIWKRYNMAAELSLYDLLQHVRLYRLVSGQEARVDMILF